MQILIMIDLNISYCVLPATWKVI